MAPSIPIDWVEKLFGRLEAILGAKMGDVYAGVDHAMVQREWGEALYGFGDDELRRGIAATRTRKFPPNLPEFLHLCRPALDPETAWIEAEEGLRAHTAGVAFGWTHAAVYWAGRRMASEIRADQFAKHRKRWETVIAAEFAKGAWASPPDPTARRLAHSQQDMVNPAMRQEAIERLAAIRKGLTGFSTAEEAHQAQLAAGKFVSVGNLVNSVEAHQ